jgi:tetratricopeptide (TPR) repeat protein
MERRPNRVFFSGTFLVSLLVFGGAAASRAADPDVKTNAAARTNEISDVQQVLRSYLQLQEQIHATQLSIERARQEAEAAAKRNAETMADRLNQIQALNLQRERELAAMQDSNRGILIVAGVFAGVGLVTMLLTAFFQWRAMHRLAQATGHSAGGGLALSHPHAALGLGEAPTGSIQAPEHASGRFLDIIERLEKRIHELESAPASPPVPLKNGRPNGPPKLARPAASPETASAPAPKPEGEKPDRLSVWLGKGQALLNMNQPENAIACFDEALVLDPANAEALIKKGLALEKLERNEEALETYDRAIAIDESMTLAWLHKGGLCNRLERHDEALRCYEQALRTQEKHRAA